MEIRVLGPLQVVDATGEDRTPPGARQRALLLHLVLHRGRTVAAESLVEQLWGDTPPGNPTNALQAQVSKLRRVLGTAEVIATRAPGYVLDLPPEAIDAARFEQLLQSARQLSGHDPTAARAQLDEALGLWRGPALAEIADHEVGRPAAVRLEELRLVALELRIDADLALGRQADVVGELEALTADNPWRERFWAQRMLALYRTGRQADALAAYREARTRLVDELGLEPGPELRDLEARILRQDRDLAAPGTHAPSSRTEPGSSSLRRPRTRFVGRAAERTQVAATLDRHRLVTLVGPGGVGKTRLATEVAAEQVEDGRFAAAWLVELAPVLDPEGVLPALLDALGVQADPAPGRPDRAAGAIDQLASHLAGRPALLVLDNCEQVVAEAACVVDELLTACPDVRVLATSREGLGVPDEALVPVAPLPPDDAVDLFADRARAVHPPFDLDRSRDAVEEICRRLDGLPLALELAAARVRALAPEEIARRLDDRFRLLTGGARTALPRQQTLRAVVDWSIDLLDDDERLLYRRLGAFVGGWSLEAAEQVAGGDGLASDEVLDRLTRLVDKSLVRAEPTTTGATRYSFLQTLWDHAREQLVASGDAAAVRDRHAAWYLDRARGHGPGLYHQGPHLLRGEDGIELDNYRQAHEWLLERGRGAEALDLATALALLWWVRGDWREALRRLEATLAAAPEADPAQRMRAEAWAGLVTAADIDHDAGAARLEEAIGTLRGLDDRTRLVEALLVRASAAMRFGEVHAGMADLDELDALLDEDPDEWAGALADLFRASLALAAGRLTEAAELSDRSVAAFRRLDDPWGQVEALATSAQVADGRGDLETSLAAHGEVIDIASRLGLAGYHAWAIHGLGCLRTRHGDLDEADELLAQAEAMATSPWIVAAVKVAQGQAARRRDRPELAIDRFEEALAYYAARQVPGGVVQARAGIGWASLDQGRADEAGAAFAAALETARATTDPRLLAAALEGRAGLAAHCGEGRLAARLLGAADSLRTGAGAPLAAGDRADVDRVTAQVVELLGATAAAEATDAGRHDVSGVLASLSGR